MIERLSIEVTDRCRKACSFCYNRSHAGGEERWDGEELIGFVRDCAAHGVAAVSFGGGEPLEYEPLFAVLTALRGVCFRSITSNGLALEEHFDRLVRAAPDKVHLSIHFPGRRTEVERIGRQVLELRRAGVVAGVNLLVRASELSAARMAALLLRLKGIDQRHIVYLPMKGSDTPSPEELAHVAHGQPFQSMSCLRRCGRSPRFASLAADKTAAWCSYTIERRALTEVSWRGLVAAVSPLGIRHCGEQLVGLSRTKPPGATTGTGHRSK